MTLPPEIRDAIREVCRAENQSQDFESRLSRFFENLMEDNLGDHDLQYLIEAVSLEEEG